MRVVPLLCVLLLPGLAAAQRTVGELRIEVRDPAGAPIDAARALQLGIVNRVVPAAELEAHVMALAELFANAAPLALRGILDCVSVGGECGIEEGLEYESAQFGLMFSTDDMREGTSAFLERRKPTFAGR